MNVQQISAGVLTNANNKTNKNDIAFKSKLTFDVGASDTRGTLKIAVQDNNGKDLFTYKGYVNDTNNGFKSEDDFVKHIARATNVEELIDHDIASINTQSKDPTLSKIALNKLNEKLQQLQQNKAILQNRSESEKKLTGFALLLPGTLREKTALFMANLKKTDGTSLEDVHLEKIIDEIKKQGKVKLSKHFNINTDFIPCKDLAGTGMGIAQKIINHPEYGKRVGKGFYAVVVQTGGGFGSVGLEFIDDEHLQIKTSECGHDLVFDPATGTQKRLGALGASTKSVISNYAKMIGINNDKDIATLIKTGKAEMSTKKCLKLCTSSNQEAIQLLIKNGIYNIKNQNAETTTLEVKNLTAFEDGSTAAIHAYADTIADHAITKINRGANLFVLSGPLAMGLNDRIMEDPKLFGDEIKDMRDLVFSKINALVGNDGTCNRLRENNNFNIVCDKSMSVADNTHGGSLLLAGKTSNFARRGEWITVSTKTLKDKLPPIQEFKANFKEILADFAKIFARIK